MTLDLHAVTRLANVSIAGGLTHQHVPTVDPKLAKRVRDVIKQHEYITNTQARGSSCESPAPSQGAR